MKKIILILFLLLTFTSCVKKEVGLEKENIVKNNNIVSNNETKIETNTGKVSSGSLIQERQEKQSKNVYELKKHKDGNIYLYKNGKQIDYLTTKANLIDSCKYKEKTGEDKIGVSYEIIYGKGKYGIVVKHEDMCGASGNSYLYAIDLTPNIDLEKSKDNRLTKIDSYNSFAGIKLNDNILKYEKLSPGDGELKTINLDNIFNKKKDKNISPKNSGNQIKTGKYSHNELIKDGYKLNRLGDINEYYKKESFDKGMWGKGIKFKTIYVKGKKILEIDNTYYSTLNGKHVPEITISNGKDSVYINNTIIPGYQFTDILPLQPIFKSNLGKSKLVIDKNLDKVNVIYNGKTFNIYSKGNLPKYRKNIEGISDISKKIEILKDEDDDEDGYVKAYIDTGKYGKYSIGNNDFGINTNLGDIGKAYYNKKYNYMLISVIYDYVGSLMLTNTYKIDLDNKKIEKLKETLGANFYFKSIGEVVPVRQVMIDDGYGKISYFEEGKSIKIK